MRELLPPGAKVVQRGGFLDSRILVDGSVADNSFVAVYGPAGVGKTFSCRLHLMRLGVQFAYLDMRARHPIPEFTRLLAEQLVGHAVKQQPLSKLLPLVCDQLADSRTLVIDSAESLTLGMRDFLRQLRELQPSSPLLLIGGSAFENRLGQDEALRMTLDRELEFKPLDDVDVRTAMPQYHAIYAQTASETLLQINRDYAYGRLRRWANFTHSALSHLEAGGRTRLRPADADAVIRHLKGVRHDPS